MEHHFQNIVLDYLRADRSMFLNARGLVHQDPSNPPDPAGRQWYCDVIAVNFKQEAVYLCEVIQSSAADSLSRRLRVWSKDWPALRKGLAGGSAVPADWAVTPWLFIPRALHPQVTRFLDDLSGSEMPPPRITFLEDVISWLYCA
jgi:hypothetical protein